MTNTLASLSQELATQQARNARRVAVMLLLVIAPSLVLFSVLSAQLSAWQLYVDTGILFAYGVATFIGLRLIQRGRVTTGMQIILFGMGLGLLALNLLVAGFGILLGITTGLLITVIAQLTMPETAANPIIVVAFVLGLFIVLLDAILPAYRLSVAELNAYVPAIVIIITVGSLYLIARQFSTYSMRGKLTLTLLLVAIVPLVLQAVSFSVLAESNLRSNAQQSLYAAANQTAGRIDRFIKDGVLNVKASARLPDVIEFLSATPIQRNPLRVAAVLDGLSSANLFIRSYAVFDLQGVTLFDTSRPNIGSNKLNEPYVQGPLQTDQPYVSDIIFDSLIGEGLIHFSAPIHNGSGSLIGIVRVAYSIAALQDVVRQAKDLGGNGSFGILLDENYFRLADGSTLTPAFKSIVPLSPDRLAALRTAERVPNVDDTQLSMNLPEFAAGLNQAGLQPFFVAEAGETIESVESEGVPDQLVVLKLQERPWLMVFGQPQAVFLAPVQDLAHGSLFLVLAISAIIVLVAARVSHTLARPILNLTTVANKVAQGDLSAQAAVETNDEIGALATTFNSTTAQLRDLIGSLEGQVSARTEQIRASAEVGRAATSILDVDELLREAVNLITDRFGFYYAAIFTLDAAGTTAVLREATGEAGRALKERRHQLAVTGQSMVGEAITTRQACIALDASQNSERFANPLLPNTRSEIALPLIAGQRVIGALDVQSEQPKAFDDTNAAVLQSMADQIAIAVQNAQTLNRAEQQAHTLAALNQMSRDLALATSLDTIARVTAQTVNHLLGSNQLSLVLKSNNPALINVRVIDPLADNAVGETQLMPTVNTFMGEALKNGETRYAPDLTQLTSQYQDAASLSGTGMRALVCLPLRVGNQSKGQLNVGSDQAAAYTAEHISQLEQIAAQMAVAIENYNLTEQTQQTLDELDAANRRLIGQAWERYTRTADVIQGEWRDGQWVATTSNNHTAPAGGHSLAVPIKVRGETIGEFNVQTEAQRTWTPDDVAFAQALIDQVGQVIENTRLLEETERFAQREQRIHQITTRIRAAGNVQAVLEATTTELAQSLGVSRAIMRLTMSDTAANGDQPHASHETAA